MKIQSVQSQVAFASKEAVIGKPVQNAVQQKLKASGAQSFFDKIYTAVGNLSGDEVYLFNSSKISRDKRRITLFGRYKAKDNAKDVAITLNSKASQKKIQSSFNRYTKNIEAPKEFVA